MRVQWKGRSGTVVLSLGSEYLVAWDDSGSDWVACDECTLI
jgi:hypothetical protein